MIKEAINRILELGIPQILDVGSLTYSDKNLHRVATERCADPLKTNTLKSIADYLEKDMDSCKAEKNIIHIVDPYEVRLYHYLNHDRDRECVLTAKTDGSKFVFGQYYDVENFIINLQANFVRTENVEKLLSFVSTVAADSGVSQEDDGCTQKVTVKKGISLKGREAVPNPIALAPFRTFADIAQPESNFVFRLREGMNGVEAALFGADGEAWKLEAIKNMEDYFHESVFDHEASVLA